MTDELMNRVLALTGAVQAVRLNAVRRMDDKTATIMLDDLGAVEMAADRLTQAMINKALEGE